MAFATTTLAVASIAATVLSTAVSVYGQVQQGKAAKAQGQYQAAVARNNQIIAERQAADSRARGKAAEAQQALKTRQLMGRQQAVLASNGVLVGQDTALDLTADTAAIGKFDALNIRSNAEREALGYEAQGVNFGAEAGLAEMRGQAGSRAATTAAFGTVLSSAGSVADKWYGFKKEGVF
jgi:hypothetical protein